MKKADIMRRAWALYRATVAEFPETRSRAQFTVCLKAAHADAATACAARREWQTMDGEQQNTALLRMAWTVKRRAEALGRSADTAWIVTPDDAQTVAAEARPRVAPALNSRASLRQSSLRRAPRRRTPSPAPSAATQAPAVESSPSTQTAAPQIRRRWTSCRASPPPRLDRLNSPRSCEQPSTRAQRTIPTCGSCRRSPRA